MIEIVRESLTELGRAPIGLQAYLFVAAVLFVFGLGACVTRRNGIGILIGIELMLNAVVLNFMAFWHFGGGIKEGAGAMVGPLFGVFIIILAACGAAVSLAVLLNLYFNFGTVETHLANELKE